MASKKARIDIVSIVNGIVWVQKGWIISRAYLDFTVENLIPKASS